MNIEELWRSLKPGRREDPQDPSSGLWIWNGSNWKSRSRFVDEWDKDYVVSAYTNCTASSIEMTLRSFGPDGTMATKDDSVRTVTIYLDLLKK